MKIALHFFIFVFLSLIQIDLSASKSDMEEASKLGQEAGKLGLEAFEKIFGEGVINEDDFLSKEDKGKRLTGEEASRQLKSKDTYLSPLEKEIEAFIEKTDEEEQFDGTEPLFHTAISAIANTDKTTGVLVQPAEYIADGENLKKCIEYETYQAFVKMNLKVKFVPKPVSCKTWRCIGHIVEKEFSNKDDAKRYKDRTVEDYKNQNQIIPESVSSQTETHGWRNHLRTVEIQYTHKVGVHCDRAFEENAVTTELFEEDVWEPEDKEFYANLKSDPKCKLIAEVVTDYGDTKDIDGRPVYRESWGKRLCFNCGVNSCSECEKLREAGGVIVGKICLKENAQGKCECWEKTYDMGGKKSSTQQEVLANVNDLWGVDGIIDPTYDKNTDFSEVIANLSVLTDLGKDIKDYPKNIDLNVRIFSGKIFQCKKNHFNNVLYDCCGSLDGGLIKLNLVDCNSEEKFLQQARAEGRTTWVGKQKTFSIDGWSETNCYCVFPTKLARVIQEHVRRKNNPKDQTHLWGTVKCPDCAGLTLDQLTDLNFEEIDLSEVIADIKTKVSQEALSKRLNHAFKNLTEEQLTQKAENSMQEMIKENEKKIGEMQLKRGRI